MNINKLKRRLIYGRCLLVLSICYAWKITRIKQGDNDSVWVIGEGYGDCHKDNGYYFFKSCLNSTHANRTYFVANPDVVRSDEFLRANSQVVEYGSVRHLNLLIYADAYIYTHRDRDIIYSRVFWFIKKFFNTDVKLVLIEHGIFGFKKIPQRFWCQYRLADLVVSVSEAESNIKKSEIGVDNSQVQIVGLPRYDFLKQDQAIEAGIEILYMPTWRDWIQSESDIHNSLYFESVQNLVNSEKLDQFLARNQARMTLFLHKSMSSFASHFNLTSKCIELKTVGAAEVQSLIKRSSILITDYSSVSWDFLYLKKPVIFYQFDREQYLKERGSYLRFPDDLFGPDVDSSDGVVDWLEVYANNGFNLDQTAMRIREQSFRYLDGLNCERLRKSILSLR